MRTMMSLCLLVIAGFLPGADGSENGGGDGDNHFYDDFPVGSIEFCHGFPSFSFFHVSNVLASDLGLSAEQPEHRLLSGQFCGEVRLNAAPCGARVILRPFPSP